MACVVLCTAFWEDSDADVSNVTFHVESMQDYVTVRRPLVLFSLTFHRRKRYRGTKDTSEGTSCMLHNQRLNWSEDPIGQGYVSAPSTLYGQDFQYCCVLEFLLLRRISVIDLNPLYET